MTFDPRSELQYFLDASNAVYNRSGVPDLTFVKSSANDIHGFYGEEFKDPSGNVLVAFEGTHANNPIYALGTLDADLTLYHGNNPKCFTDALNFVQGIITENPGAAIYVTAHSLGASEAEYVATQDSAVAGGIAFAGTGLPNYFGPGNSNVANVFDYLDYGDPVANYGADTAENLISAT